MRKSTLLIALATIFTLLAHAGAAEPIVRVAASPVSQCIALNVGADRLGDAPSYQLVAAENPTRRIPVQVTAAMDERGLVDKESRSLMLVAPAMAENCREHPFTLAASYSTLGAAAFRFEQLDDARLKLWNGRSPVFVYNFGTITDPSVPENDGRRSRSCYVHPIWGVHDEILTDDFPADHYHHHGLFWTWPHVQVDGQEYDLWTSTNIRQRFLRWLDREAGPLGAVLAVENGWFVENRQVMTERIWLRTFDTGDDSRVIDVTMVLVPGESPVRLWGSAGKSYGGLSMRFDVTPRRDAVVRAPGRIVRHVGEGLASSEDLVNMRLPWADLCSQFPGAEQRSGAAIFVHPQHPDFPPSWLTRCYGILCIGWPGVQPKRLNPGEPVVLRYRVWLHGGECEEPSIASHVAAYRAATRVTCE